MILFLLKRHDQTYFIMAVYKACNVKFVCICVLPMAGGCVCVGGGDEADSKSNAGPLFQN